MLIYRLNLLLFARQNTVEMSVIRGNRHVWKP